MGIDKPDVRFVRASRPAGQPGSLLPARPAAPDANGLPAETMMLYGMQDLVLRRRMIDDGEAPDAVKRVEQSKLDALLGICETGGCRRQALLSHFGERRDEPCGNCDTCLEPVRDLRRGRWRRKRRFPPPCAQGQRFGVGHLIDVLLGVENDRIQRLGHDSLSTYGIGKEFNRKEWSSIFRQLVVFGAAVGGT